MRNKEKQIWNLYNKDIKKLTLDCYNILSEFYLHLGHRAEAEILTSLTKVFVEDLATRYSSLELEEVRFAILKGIKDTEPPIFVNVPTWNKFLRDYKKEEALKRQTNQIEEYQLYKKRIEGMNKSIRNREVKKIGKK